MRSSKSRITTFWPHVTHTTEDGTTVPMRRPINVLFSHHNARGETVGKLVSNLGTHKPRVRAS